MFNSIADLRTDEDRRINDWFKEQLAAHERCARCGAIADSELHYVGTVDSHEFVHAGTAVPPATPEQESHDERQYAR